jgi:tetratricopeptide (TPR) repeat protein
MERHRRVLGIDHADTIATVNNYAQVLRALGRVADAEPYAHQALLAYRRVLGEDHPTTLIALGNYAALLRSLGRNAEAEASYREALERGRRVRGDDHPDTLIAMNNYGAMLRGAGRDADAQPLFAELYARAGRARIPAPVAAQLMMNYGPCLVRLGRYEQADAPLREAARRLRETNQAKTPRMRDVLAALAAVCDHTNRAQEAASLRAELQSLPAPAATRPASATKPTTVPA